MRIQGFTDETNLETYVEFIKSHPGVEFYFGCDEEVAQDFMDLVEKHFLNAILTEDEDKKQYNIGSNKIIFGH
uniref:Uncharacterized protein n=1 Tax=Panagrolaimus sp. PS1159 TaxID=55785 RepID=A0AC35F149_9BILA